MKELIAALRALQEVDKQKIEAEKERRAITERVEQLGGMLSELERELAEKHEKLREAERWYKERERELKEDNEKIKRAQGRLSNLSKAKEFAAVQREIEILRRGNAQKEEEILKLLAVMDEFKVAVEEEEAKLKAMREEVTAEKSSTKQRVSELDKRLTKFGDDRTKYETNVPRTTLQRYMRIQKAWQGLAVVSVNPKGSCGGCHRQVPPQLYNTLLRQDSLESCPYCNRYLYVDIEENQDVANG